MNAIVTGASGIIGSRLCEELVKKGHKVWGLYRRPESMPPFADWTMVQSGALAMNSDFMRSWRDWEFPTDCVVYHLAGNTNIHDPKVDVYKHNIESTLAAIELARQHKNQLVFASSSAVYSGYGTVGPGFKLMEQHSETRPEQKYGKSKLVAEQLIELSGVNAVSFRIFAVLSHGILRSEFNGKLIQQIQKCFETGEDIVLSGIGIEDRMYTAERDFVHEDDIMKYMIRTGELMDQGHAMFALGYHNVNLCTGVATSAKEMVKEACKAVGKKIKQLVQPTGKCENAFMVGDTTRLKDLFGDAPKDRIEEFWRQAVEMEIV